MRLLAEEYVSVGKISEAEALGREFLERTGRTMNLCTMHLARNEYDQALKCSQARLSKVLPFDEAERYVFHTEMGLAYEGLGNLKDAETSYRKAIDLIEKDRMVVPPASREGYLNVTLRGVGRATPYEGLARVLIRIGQFSEAWKTSEYSKARAFSEALARNFAPTDLGVPASVIARDRELSAQLSATRIMRHKAFSNVQDGLSSGYDAYIHDVEEQFEAHVRTLKEKYPQFAATRYPQPMELSETALRNSELVLAYDVTDSGVIIYLLKGKQLVTVRFKPIPRRQLDELVEKFRKPLTGVAENKDPLEELSSFDFVSGKNLADLLVSDCLSDIPENAPLIIVPDDSLGLVPFEALVLNDRGRIVQGKTAPCVEGAEFFGDRNPITYYQSVTALTMARLFGKDKKPSARILAITDPVFEPDDSRFAEARPEEKPQFTSPVRETLMPIRKETGLKLARLELTAQLGQALQKLEGEGADVLSGLMASKESLLEKPLETYGSLVFATHGYFGSDLPRIQEPVLVLTLVNQPEGMDGFLRMTEVMGLRLNASIVALTACQSGVGSRISGKGIMGMGRAFQYAGARSVLMSLWSVEQTSSVPLAEAFFRHVKEGKGKLEALRQARQEIRQAGYDHPFFWASFILTGEEE